MTLRLSRACSASLVRAATAAGRREICGVLLASIGARDVVTHAIAIPNVAARGATAFALDDVGLLLALQRAAGDGDVVRAIYHSHVDGPAVLSRADVDGALWEGAPRFPEVSLVVIGVLAGAAPPQERTIASFAYAGGAFVPEPVAHIA